MRGRKWTIAMHLGGAMDPSLRILEHRAGVELRQPQKDAEESRRDTLEWTDETRSETED